MGATKLKSRGLEQKCQFFLVLHNVSAGALLPLFSGASFVVRIRLLHSPAWQFLLTDYSLPGKGFGNREKT
ncbi:MAG: hypothetical protein KME05_09405 [Gloeocapsa sp. UFS-A4-WI-NPMV-4B04]|nr:hypothetical protein [Gloeocapsa sp. UFS-A4-WI-NPMV-4B04]